MWKQQIRNNLMNTDIALELESNAINRWKCEKNSKLQAVLIFKIKTDVARIQQNISKI